MSDADRSVASHLNSPVRKAVATLAVFTAFLMISKGIHLPFGVFSVWSVVLCAACIALLTVKYSRGQRVWGSSVQAETSARLLTNPRLYLAIGAILTATLTFSINAPEEDDSYYVSPVQHSLENPAQALDESLNWIVPWPNGQAVTATGTRYADAYPYYIGVISHFTGIDFLFAYQVLGSFLWGAAFFLVHYGLIRRFIDRGAAVFGAAIIVLATFMLFRDGGGGYGTFLCKLWIGKTILQYIFLPLFVIMVLDYLDKPDFENWLYVFFGVGAALAFSLSSIFLISAVMVCTATGKILTSIAKKDVKSTLAYAAVFMALVPLVIVGGSMYGEISTILSQSKTSLLGGNNSSSLFWNYYSAFFGGAFSFPTVLMLASLIYLAFHREKYAFVLWWVAIGLAIFVNPFTDKYVAQYLTSSLVYGRIFSVVPWLLVVGLAAADLFERYAGSLAQFRFGTGKFIATVAALVYSVLLIPPHKWFFNVPGNAYWLGAPQYTLEATPKIDERIAQDVRSMLPDLPPGSTLASMQYALAIPMMSGKHRQYYSNPYSTVSIWGEASGHEIEGAKRLKAIQYLFGDKDAIHEFEDIISTSVKNIVVDRSSDKFLGIESLAKKHGFRLLMRTERFVAYSIEAKLVPTAP